jgi:hypothetical protein
VLIHLWTTGPRSTFLLYIVLHAVLTEYDLNYYWMVLLYLKYIKFFVYKLAWEFQYELLHLATNLPISEWSSESVCQKFYEIICNLIYQYSRRQGPVVQRWISANPGLKLNPLKCQKRKLLLFQTWFVKKYFQIYKQAVRKFALNFKLT